MPAALARDVVGRFAALQQFLSEPGFIALDRRTMRDSAIGKLAAMAVLEFGRSAAGRDLALRDLLAALFANLYRFGIRGASRHSHSGARDRASVAKFREAIERRFAAHFIARDYCDELGISESRLRRACLQVVDQASVAQVAYLLGVEDPAYFTRLFRLRSGLLPKAFRARSYQPNRAVP